MLEEPLLSPYAGGETGETSVGSKDTVAGYEEHEVVGFAGGANGSTSSRDSKTFCHLSVACSLSERDLPEFFPDSSFEVAALLVGKRNIEISPLSLEVLLQLAEDLFDERSGSRYPLWGLDSQFHRNEISSLHRQFDWAYW